MRTRIAVCTCAVAIMLVTAYSLSEAADRNELGSGDPKTSGIQKTAVSQTAQAIPLEGVPDRAGEPALSSIRSSLLRLPVRCSNASAPSSITRSQRSRRVWR
jgi:hypothetical protein